MNKYNNREDKALIVFEVVGGLVVVILSALYYFLPDSMKTEPSSVKLPQAAELVASSSILSESTGNTLGTIGTAGGVSTVGTTASSTVVAKDASIVKNTIVTAYIKGINGDKITLDYFDLLGGKDAMKAIVEDKKCTQQEVDSDRCFNNGVVYFRNQNPKLRTLTLSPETEIYRTTAFDKSPDGAAKISIQELTREYLSRIYNEGQSLITWPYRITLNSNDEVVKIEEIYRP